MRGPNAGSQFLLDQPVTSAGRHPDSDIFLDDATVSRRHVEFRLENGQFLLVDLDSLNNTYVNHEPVDSAVLVNGDEIQIGKFRLVFVTRPTTAETRTFRWIGACAHPDDAVRVARPDGLIGRTIDSTRLARSAHSLLRVTPAASPRDRWRYCACEVPRAVPGKREYPNSNPPESKLFAALSPLTRPTPFPPPLRGY